jgi:hypothetical protein
LLLGHLSVVAAAAHRFDLVEGRIFHRDTLCRNHRGLPFGALVSLGGSGYHRRSIAPASFDQAESGRGE